MLAFVAAHYYSPPSLNGAAPDNPWLEPDFCFALGSSLLALGVGLHAGRAGVQALVLGAVLARVLLWIDRGKQYEDANRAILDHLAVHRADVEAQVGPTVWDAMTDSRACKIVVEVPTAPGWRTPAEERESGMRDLIDAMDRFAHALTPLIKQLDFSGLDPNDVISEPDL